MSCTTSLNAFISAIDTFASSRTQTSFDKFNLARSIWRVDRSTPFPNSIESLVLWDYDEKRRTSETKTFAQTRGYTLPSNMLESGSIDLLCYGNIWALAHASARARGWSYFSGYVPELQHESGGLLKMMDPSVRGMWPGESGGPSPGCVRISRARATLRTEGGLTDPRENFLPMQNGTASDNT